MYFDFAVDEEEQKEIEEVDKKEQFAKNLLDKKNNRIQSKLNNHQIDKDQEEFIIECQKNENLSIGKNPIIS